MTRGSSAGAGSQPLDDVELEWWYEPEEESQEQGTPPRGTQAFAAEDVSWAEDKHHPDYRHLDAGFAEDEFEFTGADLELIIRENRFEPTREEDRILFGLRGATLATGGSASGASLRLRLARPDHREFRCVIGVYDTSTRQVSGFVGSTVPWYAHVHDYFMRGRGDPKTNLLPTGCYPYFVGSHGKHQIPGCLRLGTGHDKNQQERVAVLRTLHDVRYDTTDVFDPSIPHDNLHPSFSGKLFRSRGCQTIRGGYDAGHTGEWAEFRSAAGLGNRGDNGKRFDYVLVTGLEAAIASKLRRSGQAANAGVVLERLTRLRHGSRGELVTSLQRKLGLTATGAFGAQETKALATLQRKKFGFADGIYSPDMDARLEFNILKSAPLATPAQVRHIAAGSKRIALIIGNGAYAGASQLDNPTRDADAFAEKLKSLDFSVTLLRDATENAMVQSIVKFKDDLTACHVGLIFYAGHGVQIDGENYVLPVDCNPGTMPELRQSSVSLGTLLEPLEESGKVGIIVLDCCRDNPFQGRAVSRSLRRGFANLGAPAGTFIAFSTQPGATASDGQAGQHSPFAASLLQHISAEDQDIGQVMRVVRKEVNEKTEGRQLPWDQSSLMVDHFAFKQTDRTAEHRVLTREELDKQRKGNAKEREEEYWNLTSTSNSEQLLESFIAQYPDSRYRTDADAKLREIRLKAEREKARAKRLKTTLYGSIAALILLAGITTFFAWQRNQLRDWQTRAYDGQFRLLLAKARDKLDAENPEEARSQALAARRVLGQHADKTEFKLRVGFTNIVTESLKQDYVDVTLDRSTGVKSPKVAFTPDGRHIVWTDDGRGKPLNVSEAHTGMPLPTQPRYADVVTTLITSPDGSHAALLSQSGDAELFRIRGEGPSPNYYGVYSENYVRAIAFGTAGPRLLLAAVDRDGDVIGWRFKPEGGSLVRASLKRQGQPTWTDSRAGFAISCHKSLCVWAEPDGTAFAAELGAEPGGPWQRLKGTAKLEGWSASGPAAPVLRLGNGRLLAHVNKDLRLYEVSTVQQEFALKRLQYWTDDPPLAAVDLDEQQKLVLRHPPGKKNTSWTVQYSGLANKDGKIALEHIYYRNHEKEILDFNYPLKSVVFAQQLRAGLNVLKLRTYAISRPEHECVPECDLINWLGAAGRTAVGVRLAKGDHNLYRLPLGDANSEPGKLETVDLGNELRDGFEKVRKRTALKDPQQGQPIIHPVSHALDATQGHVLALVVAPEFASEIKEDATRDERVRSAAFVAVFDLKTGRLLGGEPVGIKTRDADAAVPHTDLVLTGTFTEKLDRQDQAEVVVPVLLQVLLRREKDGTITVEHAPDRWRDIRTGGVARLLRRDGNIIRVEYTDGDKMQSANRRRVIRVASGRVVDFGFLDKGERVFVAYEEGQFEIWDLDLTNRQSDPLATIDTDAKLTARRDVSWSSNEQVLHVRGGKSIKSFNRAGLLLDQYAPGKFVGTMLPLPNGDLFAVVGFKHVVLPAVQHYQIEMDAVPHVAEVLTPRLLARSDDEIFSNWFLPRDETAQADGAPITACLSEVDSNYPYECTRLHAYYAAPEQKALAVSEHAYRALELRWPGRGAAFALAQAAEGNPLALALIARELEKSTSAADGSPSSISCEAGLLNARRQLYTHATRRGQFVAPFFAAMELRCGGSGPGLGAIASELKALGDRGDPMAFVLLGHELERSAGGDLEQVAKAVEHYGIAGRLLLAQRDRRQPKEIVSDQALIDGIEQAVGNRRAKLAARLEPPSRLAKIFETVEARTKDLWDSQGGSKQGGGAATARVLTVKDMIAALGKPDLGASIAKGERDLDQLTDTKVSAKLVALAVRGDYEVVRRVDKNTAPDKARSAYLHFLRAVQRLRQGVYAKAIIEFDDALAKELDEKARQSILSTDILRELAADFAQRLRLESEQPQMSAPKRAGLYLGLSDAAVRFPKIATRLAIAALQTSEDLPRSKRNAETLSGAQKRLLGLMEPESEHAEFALVGWNYVSWANDYLSGRFEIEAKEALHLFDTGLQLHRRYVESRQKTADYSRLRLRLAAAYKMSGRLAFKIEDDNRAVDAYTKVLEINAEDRDGYMGRATAYEYLKDYQRALADYTRAIEVSPRWDEAYRFRGGVFRTLGQYDKSLADFNKALEIDPNDSNYYFGRGRTHVALGDQASAIADFNQVVKLRPTNDEAYRYRGIARIINGEFDEAIADFNQVVKLRPTNDEAYRYRGIALIIKGQLDEAIADFTKALEIDPRDSNYYHGRAWAHFKAGRLQQALDDANSAVSMAPGVIRNPAECHDTLGQIHTALNTIENIEQANKAFARARELKPGLQLTPADTLKRLAP